MTDLGYLRVSSDEQKNKGKSIAAQKDILLKEGIKESDIYIDEGKSAGVHEEDMQIKFDGRSFQIIIDLWKRPQFLKLLSQTKAQDRIYFTKLDRLSRNIIFMEAIFNYAERKGFELIPLRDTQDKLARRVVTVISQTEIEKTAERNQSIQSYLFDQNIHPFKTPYGYIRNKRDSKDDPLPYPSLPEGALIINEKEAVIVRECYLIAAKALESGKNSLYRQVCEKYGISPQKYYDIIKNKTYTGQIHLGKEWKESPNVPAIISLKDFEEINKKK